MPRWTPPLVLWALALGGVLPLQAQARRALVIGINQYQPPKGQAAGKGAKTTRGTTWTNLDGSVNDALAMKEVLKARFGFKDAEITVLLNGQATRQGILKAIQDKLVAPSGPGDTVVFYYAGHGSQVRNSLSQEADKLDESLVPADVARGAADIRDKELKPLFNAILDKGATFTAIFDSCHSGSATRGAAGDIRYRKIEPELTDVADPVKDLPDPGKRGALILSAAQDFEPAGERKDADGVDHGLFTAALIQALKAAPEGEPARQTFLRLRALMQASGSVQEPVLEGTEARLGRHLLGDAGTRGPEARAVAASAVGEDGRIVLQGGTLHNLTPRTELRPLNEREAPGLVLQVEEVSGLSKSVAKVASGRLPANLAGVLFQVSQWAPPDRPDLTVAMGVANLTPEALAALAKDLATLKGKPGLAWVEDPTVTTPDLVLTFRDGQWGLQAAGGVRTPLKAPPTAAQVLAALAATGLKQPALWVDLPLPKAVADQMAFAPGRATPAIAVADGGATYRLASRITDEGVTYAWVLPGALAADASRVRLPLRTDWFTLEAPERLASQLEDYAGRLARLRGWLELAPPPGGTSDVFPYHLQLRRVGGDPVAIPGGGLKASEASEDGKQRGVEDLMRLGERYRPVLVLDTSRPARDLQWVRPQFVYLLAIDSQGKGTLLFPASGTVENRLPAGKAVDGPPREIELFTNPKAAIRIQPPVGVDHYVLLTTEEPIPDLAVFAFEGVRSGELKRGGPPLTRLLRRVGAGTRGAGVDGEAVPVNWGVFRFSVRSIGQPR